MTLIRRQPGDDDKMNYGLRFHTLQGPDQEPDQTSKDDTQPAAQGRDDVAEEPIRPMMRDFEDTDEYWKAMLDYLRGSEDEDVDDLWPTDEDVEEAFRRTRSDGVPYSLAAELGIEFQKDYLQQGSLLIQEYLDEVLEPYTIHAMGVSYDMSWAPGYGDGSNDVHRVYELPSGQVYVLYYNSDDTDFGPMPAGWTIDDLTERLVSNLRMFSGDVWEGTTAIMDVQMTWRQNRDCAGYGEMFLSDKSYPVKNPDYRRLLLGFPREPGADQSWQEKYDLASYDDDESSESDA